MLRLLWEWFWMKRGTRRLRLFECYIGSERSYRDDSIRLELGAIVLLITFWIIIGTVKGCNPESVYGDLYEEYYESMEEEGEMDEDEEDEDGSEDEDPDEEEDADGEEGRIWGRRGEMCRT